MQDSDINKLNQFFAAIFEPDDRIEIRFLPAHPKNQWFLDSYGYITSEFDDITKKNEKYDIFFGVNPRETKGGEAKNVTICRTLFADFDHISTDKAIYKIHEAGVPNPTALVNSGHGAHAYWRLTEPIHKDAWHILQKRLIITLGCDKAIHDAPRIVRMPYTKHRSKPGGKECKLLKVKESRYTLADMDVLATYREPDRTEAPPATDGDRLPLPNWANRILIDGAEQGKRNHELFSVAVNMAGNGWPRPAALIQIRVAAAACTPPMDFSEADAIVDSAYSGARTANTPDDDDTVYSALTYNTEQPPSEEKDAWLVVGEPIAFPVEKMLIQNAVESQYKDKTIFYPQTIHQIHEDMEQATGGWPRSAGGRLIVPGNQPTQGDLPWQSAIRSLNGKDELFAWVQDVAQLHWHNARAVTKGEHATRSVVRRNEFYEHLRAKAKPRYESSEVLPHEPPMKDTYYAPCLLKRAPRSIADEFIDRFNYDTEIDRDLMMSALLTLFWGGAPGQRPGIIFQSHYGAGSGKSTTAQLLAKIAGGAMNLDHNERLEDFKKRLLSDSGLAKRCILLDNVKTRLDAAGLEAMITLDEISGHRMYFGHASRPNIFTWYVTSNSPELSHDLAERTVAINVGRQRADDAFLSTMLDYIDTNRNALVASCLGILRDEGRCAILAENQDRWARWQSAILTRFENGNAIAAEIKDRRQKMDADLSEGEELAKVIRGLLSYHNLNPDIVKVFIARRSLTDLHRLWVGDDDKLGRKATASYINNRLGTGPLSCLKQTKYRGDRGYCWTGDLSSSPVKYDMTIQQLPDSFDRDTLTNAMEFDRDKIENEVVPI